MTRLLYILCQTTELPDSVPTRKQEIEMLRSLPFDEFVNKVVNMMVTFAINVCIAILVFLVGKFIIGKIYQLLGTIFVRRNVDRSLSTFILSFVRIVLYFILIVSVIGILGIETSSFLAIFASASVAIGLAFTGTLQNFAGGVLILVLKPYKVGDYIEVNSYAGTVKEIQIFNTIITTPDNKSIIIPNGGLSTGSINNYSKEEFRRVEWTVSISYGDDVEAARKVILDLLKADHRVVKRYLEDEACCNEADCATTMENKEEAPAKPKGNVITRLFHGKKQQLRDAIDKVDSKNEDTLKRILPKVDRCPVVYVGALADSSVNLTIRAWTRNSDYWSVFFEMNELFYTTLPQHGLHFPFPQMDVHLDHTS